MYCLDWLLVDRGSRFATENNWFLLTNSHEDRLFESSEGYIGQALRGGSKSVTMVNLIGHSTGENNSLSRSRDEYVWANRGYPRGG